MPVSWRAGHHLSCKPIPGHPSHANRSLATSLAQTAPWPNLSCKTAPWPASPLSCAVRNKAFPWGDNGLFEHKHE